MKRITEELTQVPRLTREERAGAKNLSDFEVRCLVANYYQAQGMRKASDQQIATAGDNAGHELTGFMANQFARIEADIQKVLATAIDARPIGVWLKSNMGIGPVIAAGLLAHIDIHRAPTAGHIWRYAGLDPTSKWLPSTKRPWNAELKVLCWHAGQSFMKLNKNPGCLYGGIYRERKDYEITRNESGGNATRAAEILTEKKWSKGTETRKALESGKLPAAQIDARARRYAVKLFLSHMHTVWTWLEFKRLPVKPFAIQHLGHIHEVIPQHLDLVPGLEDALRGEGRLAA